MKTFADVRLWTEVEAKVLTNLLRHFDLDAHLHIVPHLVNWLRDTGYAHLADCLLLGRSSGLAGRALIKSACENRVCIYCNTYLVHPRGVLCAYCKNIPDAISTSRQSAANNIKRTSLRKHGVTNAMKLASVKAKQQATVRANYGVSNPSQSDVVKERKVQTNLNRRGVENPQQDVSVRRKTRRTNETLYGAKETFGSPEVQERIRKTHLRKRGVDYPSQDPEVLKVRVANYRREHGVDHPFQDEAVKEKIRKTMIRRHGKANPSQVREFRNKAIKSMQRTTAVAVEGVTFYCQGYEKHVVQRLVAKFGIDNVLGQTEFDPIELPNGRTYTPDFYIVSRDTYLDIKSTFTMFGSRKNQDYLERNAELQAQCNELGVNLRFAVYYPKSEGKDLDVLPKSWCQQNFHHSTH